MQIGQRVSSVQTNSSSAGILDVLHSHKGCFNGMTQYSSSAIYLSQLAADSRILDFVRQ